MASQSGPSTVLNAATDTEEEAARKLRIKKTDGVINHIAGLNKFTLGDFLHTLFAEKEELSPKSKGMLNSWLNCNTRPGTWPVEVIDAMYQTAYSTRTGIFSSLALPQLPTQARSRRALSFLPVLSEGANLKDYKHLFNARQGVEEWIARGSLELVNREAGILETELARSEKSTWSKLSAFSLGCELSIMKSKAPVTYAIFRVVASSKAQKQSKTVALRALALESDSSEDLDLRDSDSNEDSTDGAIGDTESIDPVDLGVIFSIYTLIGFRNRLVGFSRPYMGVFLFASGVPKAVFRTLCRVRFCSAHSTVLNILRSLGASAKARLRRIGKNAFKSKPPKAGHVPEQEAISGAPGSEEALFTGSDADPDDPPPGPFMLIFDNINKFAIPRSETVGNKSKLQSGTASTLVMLEDVPEGALARAPYKANVDSGARQNMTLDELWGDINYSHLSNIGTGTVMRILVKHIEPLKHLKQEVTKSFKDPLFCAVEPLRPQKTRIYPMATSGINESTAEGASEVLDDLVQQLGLEHNQFDDTMVLVGGDQLSVDQMRKSILYMGQESSVYNQKSWVIPVVEPWHMGWAYLKAVVRTHWFGSTGKDTLGFRRSVGTLGRSINTEKYDYYPCFDAVTTVFEGMVLSATRVVLRRENRVDSETNRSTKAPQLLEELAAFFKAQGSLENCSLEQLKTLSRIIYNEYMTTESYYSALNPTSSPSQPSTLDISNVLAANLEHQLHLETLSARDSRALALSQRQNIPSTKAMPSSLFTGDQVLSNGKLFMRDALYMVEFAASMREGDPGRLFRVMDIFRFAFWGANSTNYGAEMLEMACSHKYEYSVGLQATIRRNILVNPSGLSGHWQAGDLLQEHHNQEIKNIFNSKNSDFDDPFLRESISLNITGFSQMKEATLRLLGLAQSDKRHAPAQYREDMNVLGAHYESERFFEFTPGRKQPYQAGDMIAAGYTRLESGALKSFIERTVGNPYMISDSTQAEEENESFLEPDTVDT